MVPRGGIEPPTRGFSKTVVMQTICFTVVFRAGFSMCDNLCYELSSSIARFRSCSNSRLFLRSTAARRSTSGFAPRSTARMARRCASCIRSVSSSSFSSLHHSQAPPCPATLKSSGGMLKGIFLAAVHFTLLLKKEQPQAPPTVAKNLLANSHSIQFQIPQPITRPPPTLFPL
jgi:hypothetical protein